jgi:hypothetical protein
LDNTLAEILGYSHSREKAGDLVVEVLNDSNVPVWYQNTNIQDEASAKKQLKIIWARRKHSHQACRTTR